MGLREFDGRARIDRRGTNYKSAPGKNRHKHVKVLECGTLLASLSVATGKVLAALFN